MQHDALALFLHFSPALFFGTLFNHLLDQLLLCTLSGKICRNILESLLLGQYRPVGFPNKTTTTTTTMRAERRHRNASPGRAPTTAGFTMEDIKRLQDSDASLASARQAASNHSDSSFFYRDGLLFHQCRGADPEVNQLVLPYACRKQVLYMAHTMPLAGHLGTSKTRQRILQRFYWPSLSSAVKDYCASCRQCQMATNRRPPRAPMIPMPVLDELFSRIAMDIAGP